MYLYVRMCVCVCVCVYVCVCVCDKLQVYCMGGWVFVPMHVNV